MIVEEAVLNQYGFPYFFVPSTYGLEDRLGKEVALLGGE